LPKKHARTLPKRSPQLPHSDDDGNQIHNGILLSLPREEREIVFSKLEFVRLGFLQVLHEPGDSIKSAYFCDSGMISTLNIFTRWHRINLDQAPEMYKVWRDKRDKATKIVIDPWAA